jgi:hypothetical protein
MTININTNAVVKHTAKLEKLHKSALPVAVRATLNSAAFDVKTTTMPKKTETTFINKEKNFFKANSHVDMAKGFDLKSMQATVGFTESGLTGGNNFAVKDLEQQEQGGSIKGKSFIPMDPARGGNKAKTVRPVNRISAINKIANSAKGRVKGKNKQERFVKSAIYAGAGGYVLGNFERQKLFRIKSIKRKKGQTIVKKVPIYSFEENRSVRVKSTGFMKAATIESANKMESFYIREAEKQIKRLNR